MKRQTVAVVFVLLLLCTQAQAVETRSIQGDPALSFWGTTAFCSVSLRGESSSDKMEATLTLYQGNTYVDSWSDSGTGSVFISESCEVKSGKSYRLVLDYTVNGKSMRPMTTTGTCP